MKIMSFFAIVLLLTSLAGTDAALGANQGVHHNHTAYYVATAVGGGSDSNDGFAPSVGGGDGPFLTLGKCQSAMRASNIKICYIRGGTYSGLSMAGTDCNFGANTEVVNLGPTDAGETWSYYPPDGYGSAIFDGGSSSSTTGIGCLFQGFQTSNITFNGLQVQNFRITAFWLDDVSNLTIVNNTIHDTHDAASSAAIQYWCDSGSYTLNGTINNNFLYNTFSAGIALDGVDVAGNCGFNQNVVTVSGNILNNTCTGLADCGAIYLSNTGDPTPAVGTSTTITNNWIRDSDVMDSGNGGAGIYEDGGNTNVTVSGNVIGGKMQMCLHISGSTNQAATGNICDIDNATTPGYVLFYHTSSIAAPMTGNSFTNNIVVADSSSSGSGYGAGGIMASAPINITNNAYHNYVGASVNSGGLAYGAPDSNPVSVTDPKITCWAPVIDPTSLVFSSPVNFAGVPTGWGPGGNTAVPRTGTPPSWPHGC